MADLRLSSWLWNMKPMAIHVLKNCPHRQAILIISFNRTAFCTCAVVYGLAQREALLR